MTETNTFLTGSEPESDALLHSHLSLSQRKSVIKTKSFHTVYLPAEGCGVTAQSSSIIRATVINQSLAVESQVISWGSGVMETTGTESLEIDRGAFYSGQTITAEETRAARVISSRVQVPQSICNFTVNDPLLEVTAQSGERAV